MNIIVFIENLEILKEVFIFKNIYYYYSQNEEDKRLCNYLIYDEYYFKDDDILNIFKKVFINYNSDYLEDYNKLLITNNIYLLLMIYLIIFF